MCFYYRCWKIENILKLKYYREKMKDRDMVLVGVVGGDGVLFFKKYKFLLVSYYYKLGMFI